MFSSSCFLAFSSGVFYGSSVSFSFYSLGFSFSFGPSGYFYSGVSDPFFSPGVSGSFVYSFSFVSSFDPSLGVASPEPDSSGFFFDFTTFSLKFSLDLFGSDFIFGIAG